jgi:hypothetical protein
MTEQQWKSRFITHMANEIGSWVGVPEAAEEVWRAFSTPEWDLGRAVLTTPEEWADFKVARWKREFEAAA